MKRAFLLGFLLIGTSLGAQPFYRRFIAPNFSAPPTCNATSKGYIYLDTDDNSLNYCNGTAYVLVAGSGGAFDLTADHTFTGLNNFNRTAAGNDACFGATDSICVDGDTATITGVDANGSLDRLTFDVNAYSDQQALFKTSTVSFATLSPTNQTFINSGTLTARNSASTFSLAVQNSSNANHLRLQTAIPALDGVVLTEFNLLNFVPTNADHTGGTVNGIKMGAITGDAQATENAINIGTGWDADILFASGALIITQSATELHLTIPTSEFFGWGLGTTYIYLGDASATTGGYSVFRAGSGGWLKNTDLLQLEVDGNIGVMDGSDTMSLVSMEAFTDVNHTGTSNFMNALLAGAITSPDTNAIHSALRMNAGWDAIYTANAGGAWAAAESPPVNFVAFFIDEATNRTGGAGADCVFVARKSDGTEVSIAVLVTDGGCP